MSWAKRGRRVPGRGQAICSGLRRFTAVSPVSSAFDPAVPDPGDPPVDCDDGDEDEYNFDQG